MKPELTVDGFGTKRWVLNGLFHRTDGPAIENKEGAKFWFLYGVHLSEQQWQCKVLFDKVSIKIV